MKLVLQDLKTLNYVYRDQEWTPHAEAATGFSDPIAASNYAVRHNLAHVRMAMKFTYSVQR